MWWRRRHLDAVHCVLGLHCPMFPTIEAFDSGEDIDLFALWDLFLSEHFPSGTSNELFLPQLSKAVGGGESITVVVGVLDGTVGGS